MKIDYVELWVADTSRTLGLLTDAFCFRPISDQRLCGPGDRVSLVWGDVRLALRGPGSDEVSLHVQKHGDSIADVALSCSDVGALARRARAHGLGVEHTGNCYRIDLLGDGMIRHSVRESGTTSD